MIDLTNLNRSLARACALKPNWDRKGASPISREALFAVEQLLESAIVDDAA